MLKKVNIHRIINHPFAKSISYVLVFFKESIIVFIIYFTVKGLIFKFESIRVYQKS